MFKFKVSTVLVRNVFTSMAILGAGVAHMSAQSAVVSPAMASAPAALDFRVPALDTSSDRFFSSSADENAAEPVVVASLHPVMPNFADAMQYGGGQRRRYGKPRYRGANTNADGSSKYIVFGGVGLVQTVGNTYHYLNPSYGIQVGGGRQLNRHFAVPIQFDYDHFGFAKGTLGNQFALENYLYDGELGSLDGSTHIWSFSVDPTYTFLGNAGEKGGLGGYVVAGVGFYHKVANFTTPETVQGYDYYGYPIEYTANETIDHYTSNAPGFSGGLGLTYKVSKFANERFYIEARYVFIDNSQRQGYTVQDAANNTIPLSATNFYPANSNRTSYIPIKVGLRF